MDSSSSKKGTEPALSSKTVLFWYRWIAETGGGAIEGNLEKFARRIGISPSVARRAVFEMERLGLLDKSVSPKAVHRFELTKTGLAQETVPRLMPSIAPMVESMLAKEFGSKDPDNSDIEKNLASLGITERLLMATLMINADAQGYITGRSIGALSAISGIPKRSIKLYLKGFKQSGLIDYLPGFRGVGRLGACNGLIRVRLEALGLGGKADELFGEMVKDRLSPFFRWVEVDKNNGGRLPGYLVNKAIGGMYKEAQSMASILRLFASWGMGEQNHADGPFRAILRAHSNYFSELVWIESVRVFNEDAAQVEKEKLPVSEEFVLGKISKMLPRIDVGLPEFSVPTFDSEKKKSALSEKERERIVRNKEFAEKVSKSLSEIDAGSCVPDWESLDLSKQCRKLLAALIAWKAIGVSLFIAQYNLKVSDENARIKEGCLIHVLSHLPDGPNFYQLDAK